MHNRLRARLRSGRNAHAIGRNAAGCLFAVLATCASTSSAFDAFAAPHRTVVMRDDTPVRGRAEEGLASVTSATSSFPPIEDTSEPFGLGTISVVPGELQAKWRKVEVDIRADMEILAHCREQMQSCPPAAQRFLAIIEEGRARTGRGRIGVINRAVNLAIRPTSDFAQWGVPDHWSSPLETLSTGRGDCEDYAIAKYIALVEAGIAEQDVKLIIEQDLATKQDHAVVATRYKGAWIVLDNRWFALVQDHELRRMIPLFVLDFEGVAQFARSKDDRILGSLADRETVPAAIPGPSERPKPNVVIAELSRRRSEDVLAFLNSITNSVDSGNLLIERRLTIADMREYATRTYRLDTADDSGN